MILDAAPTLTGNTTTVVETARAVQILFNIDEQAPWLRYAFFSISIATGIVVALAAGAVYFILSKRISSSRGKGQGKRLSDDSSSDETEDNEASRSGRKGLDDVQGTAGGQPRRGESSYFVIRSRTSALEEENRAMRKRIAELEARLNQISPRSVSGAAEIGRNDIILDSGNHVQQSYSSIRRGGGGGGGTRDINPSAIVWSTSSPQPQQEQRGISPANYL